jgi:hypothetical protein
MVVVYRKVNSKIVFDSYPMLTIEQAFEQFGGAAVFSVLDLNSAYYQIPLSVKTRRVTAFARRSAFLNLTNWRWGSAWALRG